MFSRGFRMVACDDLIDEKKESLQQTVYMSSLNDDDISNAYVTKLLYLCRATLKTASSQLQSSFPWRILWESGLNKLLKKIKIEFSEELPEWISRIKMSLMTISHWKLEERMFMCRNRYVVEERPISVYERMNIPVSFPALARFRCNVLRQLCRKKEENCWD